MKTTDISHEIASKADHEEATARHASFFIFSLGMLILTLSFLSSCNTTRGFGRDVQKVGSTIERQAVKVQSGR
ncbi:entericidin A/B family lipoprotein [Prosthecobacter dejongeii]|uniref:Putative small secreted protein n=1 Tax=Prosthecobacter dejongeii TaxID=48465 RepID=A0A7W7YPE2_9BACT|nr:entericidin A/B family lipoprotein [Prosthecobacter dejongeii]MBB5039916.1 putative small secreted protein [Prosthecobacter dejongeii]